MWRQFVAKSSNQPHGCARLLFANHNWRFKNKWDYKNANMRKKYSLFKFALERGKGKYYWSAREFTLDQKISNLDMPRSLQPIRRGFGIANETHKSSSVLFVVRLSESRVLLGESLLLAFALPNFNHSQYEVHFEVQLSRKFQPYASRNKWWGWFGNFWRFQQLWLGKRVLGTGIFKYFRWTSLYLMSKEVFSQVETFLMNGAD